MTTITFQQPFYGLVYAKGFSQECQMDGNGTKIIQFSSPVHKCGIKISENKGLYQFELHLYVQYDKNIQQSQDDRILVRCAPQEILLSGGMGRRSDEAISKSPNLKSLHGDSRIQIKPMDNHHFAESTVASVECFMDIFRGRIPHLKTIDSHVNIGEDITVLVKIKKMLGIDTRLSRCFAHDRSMTTKFDLTDEDGCTLDSVIMPNFKEFVHDGGNTKALYSTFPAFKFPDRSNLHIQCTVVVCNTTCPKFDCLEKPTTESTTTMAPIKHLAKRSAKVISKKYTTQPNIVRRKSHNGNWTLTDRRDVRNITRDKLLSQIGISTAVDVVENNGNSINSKEAIYYKESGVFDEFFGDEAVSCFTSPSVMLSLILLSSSFLAGLCFAIFMGLKVQSLKKQLFIYENFPSTANQHQHQHQHSLRTCFHPYYRNDIHNFSYGRMVDLTMAK
ncbi:uncharacterized protein LOC128397983 isoform X3 [Panonychus citri]|nr:uncharacterized protein LOC128397983 isoform X3 [Panonychus citri]